jgi:hypothetical protein
MATVYVAGKYWADGRGIAVRSGFGIMEENGMDLMVEDPRPKLEVDRGGENAGHGEMVVKRKRKGKGKMVSDPDKLRTP